jgi:copper chaperone NosL
VARDRRSIGLLVAVAAAGALVVALVALAVARSGGVPDGPQPVVWNREPCGHCRMLVGEPGFAAQLITSDGTVVAFDDPGCLLRFLDERRPAVHRLWFHRHDGDGWLGPDEVAFRREAQTPMGYGLAAVERGAPGALDLEAARAWVRARDAAPPTGATTPPTGATTPPTEVP